MSWQHFVEVMHREMSSGFVASSLLRLLLAAILGGLIGLERELKHRAAGLRTNMFICFGAALFTVMFATGMVLLTLFLLGQLEETFNLKVLLSCYEVTGSSVEEISNEVNRILEPHHRLMQNVSTASTGQHLRLQFDVEGCYREQKQLFGELKASTV